MLKEGPPPLDIFEKSTYLPIVNKIDVITGGDLTQLVNACRLGFFPKAFSSGNEPVMCDVDFISPDPDFAGLYPEEQKQIESEWLGHLMVQNRPSYHIGKYTISGLYPVIAMEKPMLQATGSGRVITDRAWADIVYIMNQKGTEHRIVLSASKKSADPNLSDFDPLLFSVGCNLWIPPTQGKLIKALQFFRLGETHPKLEIYISRIIQLARSPRFDHADWSYRDIIASMILESEAGGSVQISLDLPSNEDEDVLYRKLVMQIPPIESPKRVKVKLLDRLYSPTFDREYNSKTPASSVAEYSGSLPNISYPLNRTRNADFTNSERLSETTVLKSLFSAARMVFGNTNIT